MNGDSVSLKSVFILIVILLMAGTMGWAQRSGIQGTVTDKSGGVMPGAEVIAKNSKTGVSRQVVTDDSGFFSIPLLKEGRYELSCAMSGFDSQRTEIVVEIGNVSTHDFQLNVGAPTNVVEVTSTAARIQTKGFNVGTVIEEKQIHELPLNGRNYLTLAQLSPGVLRGSQSTRGEQTAGEGGFRASGLAFDQTAILVDGVDNASRTVSGPLNNQAQTLKPAIEAVSEFKVITNNISAEYGYKAGAQIMVSTKSGSNQFHGVLYEFHRNAAQAANNFMFNRDAPRDPQTNEITRPTPPYIRNQFGGTFGGPIIKDRTFFFVSYQGTRSKVGGTSFLQSVPSPLARTGDFSQEVGGGARRPNIYDPLTLTGSGATAERLQFPGNIIPQNRMDPATAQMIQIYPMPNLPGNQFGALNYFADRNDFNDNDVVDTRVDHNFNDNHRIFGRYSYRTEDGIREGLLPFPANAANIIHYSGHQVALNYNASLGARSHNELRFGITHFPTFKRDDHTENLNQKFGIPNAAVDQFPELVSDEFKSGLAQWFPGGFTGIGGGSGGGAADSILDTLYVANNFLIDRGNHSLKFGAEYRRWRSNHSQCGEAGGCNLWGFLVFDQRFTAQFPNSGPSRNTTGHTMATALLGMAHNIGSGLPTSHDYENPYWGFYVQDDWRVTPKLTVNLGLRWEVFQGPNAINIGGQNFVSRATFGGDLWQETDDLDITFTGREFPEFDGDCGCQTDTNNWAPRIGIAYRVTENTVIRAGGGVFYSENGTVQSEAQRFGVNGRNATNNDGGFETTTNRVSIGFPLIELEDTSDPTALLGGGGFIPEFQDTISSGQWFLDVQHQLPWDVLVTLGYNGASTSHLPWWIRNISYPLTPGTTGVFSRLRTPLPTGPGSEGGNGFANARGNRASIVTTENRLNASYNAFVAKAEKRFSDGFSFLGSFTWSKSMDYGVSSLNERGEGIGTWNSGSAPSTFARNIAMNRGRSGLSRDFAYSMSVLYELPAGPGKGRFESGPASWVLGGWQLGTILQLQSGPWISHSFFPDTQNTGGPYRGDLVGEINLPESQRDSLVWFNESAIEAGPPAQFGTAGRGLIEGAGWKNVDLLLSKNFQLPWEGHRIQFRFEAFNLTNTPHLGPPTQRGGNVTRTLIGQGNAARILAADEARTIQFALKYTF